MADISIRGVDEDAWAEFKSNAAANKLTMSEYLEKLLQNDKKEETNLNKVLFGKKVLDEKTAKIMLENSKKTRKNFKMRELNWS